MTVDLKIFTQINSRYQVFDKSGKLSFSVLFGLCRKSSSDNDSRPLHFDVAGSALDTPYAVTHGLLTLHEYNAKDEDWYEVDVNQLGKIASKATEHLSLSSPIGRTQSWRDALTVYQSHLDVKSELAAILLPGKQYRLNLASKDLGVKQWTYGDLEQIVSNDTLLLTDGKLINSNFTGGNADFRVVESLPWPPTIETNIRLGKPLPPTASAYDNVKDSNTILLEVCAINPTAEVVTVQTRGHQNILTPWGPFQPEPAADDDRVRIIDDSPNKTHTSSLQVIDAATGQIAWDSQPSRTGPLMDSSADRRPKIEDLVMLKPGTPLVREVDITKLLDGLEDGEYKVRIQPKGCRWWHGKVETGDDGKVPASLCKVLVPPLMLESMDELCIRVKDRKIYQSS